MDTSDDESNIENTRSETSSDFDSDSSLEDDDGKPVQVVAFKRSGDNAETLQLQINHKNLDNVMNSCGNRPVSIISILGPTQTGKSSLLNCIKDKLQSLEDDGNPMSKNIKGFAFKSNYHAVTKGIWMWSKAFIVDGEEGELAVILMDTEGINDEISLPDEIISIFGLSILSSSKMIINTVGELHRPIFDKLELFVGKKPKSQDLPKLSFVVRDWDRLSISRYGDKGGQKHFSQFITDHSSRCRKVSNAFDETECFLLPHIGEKALFEKFSGQISDVGKDFIKYMKAYCSGVTNSNTLIAKSVLGCEITASEFKSFFLEFVNFFNNAADIELGPIPEQIANLIKQTAGKIKIDRGMKEYQNAISSRQNSLLGYMHDSMLDSLLIQAKRKALEAFGQLELRKEDEKYFLDKFEQQLKEFNENAKLQNKSVKTAKIDECLSQARTQMQEELDQNFPFESMQNPEIPKNMIFYEQTEMENVIDITRQLVLDQFLAEFEDEDDDELNILRKKLNACMKPLEDEVLQKNSENQERAENNAASVTDKLFEEYNSGMEKKIKRLRKLDEDTLSVFHEGELEKIEHKFENMILGNSKFSEFWRSEMIDKIETQFENMKLGLESTMVEALNLIRQTANEYEKEIKATVDGLDEDQLLSHHQERSQAALRKFLTINPYPTSSPKHDEVESKLKTKLHEVYTTVVEEGILVQKKHDEQLATIGENVIQILKSEMQNSLKDTDFLETDDSQDLIRSTNLKALHHFDSKVLTVGADASKIKAEREKLEANIKAYQEHWQLLNTNIRESAKEEAQKLVSYCTELYETKMNEKLKKIQTMEKLAQEHEVTKTFVTLQFQQKSNSKNSFLVAKSLQKLEENLANIFEEVEENFQMIRNNYDVGLRAALFDAKSYYQDNMDKRFKNNKSGYFDDATLEKMNQEIYNAAMKTVSGDHKLNESQKQDLTQEMERLFQKYKDKNRITVASYSKDNIAIGIDLGTTYCCVAAYINGEVKIIRANSTGLNITPSYVEIKPDGIKVVGQAAKTNAFKNPEATIFDAKRMIGRRLSDKHLQEDMKFWPFTVVEKDSKAQVLVNGKHYLPEQISSMILQHLKTEAEDILGVKVKKAVITVPAYFTDGQRQATLDAGDIAGIEVLGLLNEPTAAALAYRLEWHSAGKSRVVLVYDLGGGTFDVAILKISDTKLDVLTINGDSHLGGEDFDKNMMSHCAAKFQTETGIDLFEGKDSDNKIERDKARRRLRRLQFQCEDAKKQLATAPTTTVTLDEMAGGKDLSVEIRRKEFEDMNQALFQKTIDIVADAIKSAGIQMHEVDDIVLVGGSTRIRKIQELLQKFFNGKTLNKTINPDEAVAYGAAVQAASLNATPGSKPFDFGTIEEVTPMSLGIEISTGEMDIIIPKNTKIPSKMLQEYRTYKQGQTSAAIRIYQGEETIANKNKLLGDFLLNGIPSGPAGKECVDVTMTINNNGILNVEAVPRSTKGRNSITVSEDKGRLSKDQKRRLRDEASK